MVYIDLFAGAGGLSEGFKRAGFVPIAHVEANSSACFTLKTRNAYHALNEAGRLEIYYSYLKGEITRKELYEAAGGNTCTSVINQKIGVRDNKKIFNQIDELKGDHDIDLIIGGPPCQAYSYIGRAAMKNSPKKEDERTSLYLGYGKFLKRYNPKVFVFENVPGLRTAGNGKYLKNLIKYFDSIGYHLEDREWNASDFGVVQNRERLIIVGWRKDLNFSYPDFETVKNKYTRADIFDDLAKIAPDHKNTVSYYQTKEVNTYLQETGIRNGVDFVTQHVTRPHNKRDLDIYSLAIEEIRYSRRLKNNQIPEGKRTQKNVEDFLDRFKVVDHKPHTVIAHIAKDGHHFIHPDPNQLRSISVREAARIQSFPDDFFFESCKEGQYRTAAFRQIGNAVPPLMAYSIALKIKNQLENDY